MFEDVLKETIQFLKEHPTETILMRLKEETTPESGSLSFEEIFLKYKNVNASYFWNPNSVPTSDRNNPTLGDTREKIVILQNFTSTQLYGIDYESLNIQDKFEIGSGPDEIYAKWIAIKPIYKIQILILIMEKFISTILVVREAQQHFQIMYILGLLQAEKRAEILIVVLN